MKPDSGPRERPRASAVWLLTAEPSADKLAAELAPALRARLGAADLAGVTGPRTRDAGVRTLARGDGLGVVGLVEAASRLPAARRLVRALEARAAAERPAVVLSVDSPSLWLPLARRLRRQGIPVAHWVCPQVWAWRPGRAARLHEAVDLLLCLLPFEVPLLAPHPVRAIFTGHPAAVGPPARPPDPAEPPVYLLCPGSRSAELARLWPVFRATARRLASAEPGARLRVLAAPGVAEADLGGLACDLFRDLDAAADGVTAALAASGTITVELAARGVPMVVAYAVHPVTWALGRRLVRGVRHVALPNLVAGEALVREHLQHLDPAVLARDLRALAGIRGAAQRRGLAAVRAALAGEGAVDRAADAVVSLMEKPARR